MSPHSSLLLIAGLAVAANAMPAPLPQPTIPKNNYFAKIASDGNFKTRESSQWVSVAWPTETAQKGQADSPWASVKASVTDVPTAIAAREIPRDNYFTKIANDGNFNTRESSEWVSVVWPTETAQKGQADSPWASVKASVTKASTAITARAVPRDNYFTKIAHDGNFNTRESSEWVSVVWPTETAQKGQADSPWASVKASVATSNVITARAVPRDNYFTKIANDGNFNKRKSSEWVSVVWPTETAQKGQADSPWASVKASVTTFVTSVSAS